MTRVEMSYIFDRRLQKTLRGVLLGLDTPCSDTKLRVYELLFPFLLDRSVMPKYSI